MVIWKTLNVVNRFRIIISPPKPPNIVQIDQVFAKLLIIQAIMQIYANVANKTNLNIMRVSI